MKPYATKKTFTWAEHPKATTETALKRVREKIDKLSIAPWLQVENDERSLRIVVDQQALENTARLDGCYVLVSDLSAECIDAQTIHARYKDLAHVERGFRTSKRGHLELRPIYVRTEKSTRGHVFVVMLAYLIRRELERAWSHLDLTVEEGLDSLKTLCAMTVSFGKDCNIQKLPTPREQSQRLLASLDVQLPSVLPARKDTCSHET